MLSSSDFIYEEKDMEKQNFVKTTDPLVAEELRKSGFTELEQSGGFYNFINNGMANFSEDKKNKIAFTNVMVL